MEQKESTTDKVVHIHVAVPWVLHLTFLRVLSVCMVMREDAKDDEGALQESSTFSRT